MSPLRKERPPVRLRPPARQNVCKEAINVKRPSYRYQRTICRPAEVRGTGYVTGASVRLRFVPAPPSTGVVFVRTDLGPQALLPATIDRVTGTQRRTTLGSGPLT